MSRPGTEAPRHRSQQALKPPGTEATLYYQTDVTNVSSSVDKLCVTAAGTSPDAAGMRPVMRCGHPGCTKSPKYGLSGSNSASMCDDHKEPGMVNVEGRRCDCPGGCTTQPSFRPPGSKVGIRCVKHKELGMVDVVRRRCDHPECCAMRPFYGLPGSKTGTRCAAHKELGMVDVVGKRCDHPDGCETRPLFGFPGSKPTRCSYHKEPGMVDVVTRRCELRPSRWLQQAGFLPLAEHQGGNQV